VFYNIILAENTTKNKCRIEELLQVMTSLISGIREQSGRQQEEDSSRRAQERRRLLQVRRYRRHGQVRMALLQSKKKLTRIQIGIKQKCF